jgi:hypothetical protein
MIEFEYLHPTIYIILYDATCRYMRLKGLDRKGLSLFIA